MPFATPSGVTDAYCISRVRRNLRDQPVTFPESFQTDAVKGSITGAGSSPYRLKRAPLYTGFTPVVTLAGTAQTVTVDGPIPGAANTVNFVSETGEFYFQSVPAGSQTINVTYQALRFSDQQILDALHDGLYEMWPDIWVPQVDSSLIYSPMTTEYTLPAWANDPRVKIISVEMQPPAGILVSIETGAWRRPSLQNLVFDAGKPWPAGTIIRITYNNQYRQLADVDEQVVQLPIYYATFKLLLDQESIQSRANDLQSQTQEGPAKAGSAAQVAELWYRKFEAGRQRLAVQAPSRSMLRGRSVETVLSGGGFEWNPI